MELTGDEVSEEGTEEWVSKVDRGGLWHVNDETYNVFVALEGEAKKILKITKKCTQRELEKKAQGCYTIAAIASHS